MLLPGPFICGKLPPAPLRLPRPWNGFDDDAGVDCCPPPLEKGLGPEDIPKELLLVLLPNIEPLLVDGLWVLVELLGLGPNKPSSSLSAAYLSAADCMGLEAGVDNGAEAETIGPKPLL